MDRVDKRPWIALFSQTGGEIVSISSAIGRLPDLIITNKRPENLRKIHPLLENRYTEVSNTPSDKELLKLFKKYENPFITLHGWLRIVPPSLCNTFEIYNGHPGLITDFPELKGKDPQEKAHRLGLPYSGCVIHKVTEGVDEGPILKSGKISIENLELPEIFDKLYSLSLKLWIDFLKEKL